MAGVDYWAIETELKHILDSDVTLNGVHITLENDLHLNLDHMPAIGIYLDSMQVPAEQPIAAGQRMRRLLTFSIWAFVYDVGEVSSAAKKRDDLIAKLEIILMNNRTLNSKVDTAWIEAGQFESAADEDTGSIVMGAEIKLVADVEVISI